MFGKGVGGGDAGGRGGRAGTDFRTLVLKMEVRGRERPKMVE